MDKDDGYNLEIDHPSLAFLQCSSKTKYYTARPTLRSGDSTSEEESYPYSISTHLSDLSTSILTIASNGGDILTHSLLAKHLSPSFTLHKDYENPSSHLCSANGRDILSNRTEVLRRIPNLGGEVLSSIAKVREDGMKAEVWAWLAMRGMPVSEAAVQFGGERVEGSGICKECVCVWRWEREGESAEWRCGSARVARRVFGV